MATLRTIISGKIVNPPTEWLDSNVEASFLNLNIQPNIALNELTLVNEAAQVVKTWFNSGPGAYVGCPIKMQIVEGPNSTDVFNGYIDFTEKYIELNPTTIKVKLKELDGLDSFNDKIQSTTFGYLESIGVFGPTDYVDVDYLVEKPINLLELAILSLSVFLMIKELTEAIKRLADRINDTTAHSIGGVSGPAAGGFYTAFAIIIDLLYIATMTVAIISMVNDIIQLLFSPVRQHKAISLGTLMRKSSAFLGWNLNSNISQLDSYYYLPSKPEADQPVSSGIPKEIDFGYRVDEIFTLAQRLFYARIGIIGNSAEFYNVEDPFWLKTASYKMPDTIEQEEVKEYNVDEMRAIRIISYRTDIADEWTIDNFSGTNYEVTTTLANPAPNVKLVNIKGVDRVDLPVALGNRKDQLNAVENAVKVLAGACDAIINFFGGSSNKAGKIKQRIGMLKVTQNIFNQPKLLPLNANLRLDINHRDQISAEFLYNNFHIFKSFVRSTPAPSNKDFFGQKRVFKGVKIGFGLQDYQKLVTNSYFTTPNNQVGKVTSFKWNFAQDFAIVDFWIRETFTQNLNEIYRAP